jgi:hypothetical protein
MIASSGLLSIIAGLCCLVLNKHLSRWAISSQNLVWGFKFGERERRGFRISFVVFGALLIVLGFLDMSGVLPARSG